jgi:hypothetical protein
MDHIPDEEEPDVADCRRVRRAARPARSCRGDETAVFAIARQATSHNGSKRQADGYHRGDAGVITRQCRPETRRAEMGVAEVAGLVVRPAVTGTMRARMTKSRQHSVAKKQWIAYIGVAILSTVLSKTLNDLIERRLAPEDADVALSNGDR